MATQSKDPERDSIFDAASGNYPIDAHPTPQPRSGERIQPTAQAVGNTRASEQSPEGVKENPQARKSY